MKQSTFSLKRVWLLLYIDIKLSLKSLLLMLLIPLVLFYISSLDPTYTTQRMYDSGLHMFKGYILIGGIALSSYAFSQMYTKSKNHFWYMLAANQLEKFISKLLFSLFYFLFILVLFPVIMVITQMYLGSVDYINIYSSSFLEMLGYFEKYILYTSIFLLGASLFRKYTFLKTIVSIFVIITTIIVTSFIWLEKSLKFSLEYKDYIMDLNIVILITSVLFLWLLSYYFMKRSQVSDGV